MAYGLVVTNSDGTVGIDSWRTPIGVIPETEGSLCIVPPDYLIDDDMTAIAGGNVYKCTQLLLPPVANARYTDLWSGMNYAMLAATHMPTFDVGVNSSYGTSLLSLSYDYYTSQSNYIFRYNPAFPTAPTSWAPSEDYRLPYNTYLRTMGASVMYVAMGPNQTQGIDYHMTHKGIIFGVRPLGIISKNPEWGIQVFDSAGRLSYETEGNQLSVLHHLSDTEVVLDIDDTLVLPSTIRNPGFIGAIQHGYWYRRYSGKIDTGYLFLVGTDQVNTYKVQLFIVKIGNPYPSYTDPTPLITTVPVTLSTNIMFVDMDQYT